MSHYVLRALLLWLLLPLVFHSIPLSWLLLLLRICSSLLCSHFYTCLFLSNYHRCVGKYQSHVNHIWSEWGMFYFTNTLLVVGSFLGMLIAAETGRGLMMWGETSKNALSKWLPESTGWYVGVCTILGVGRCSCKWNWLQGMFNGHIRAHHGEKVDSYTFLILLEQERHWKVVATCTMSRCTKWLPAVPGIAEGPFMKLKTKAKFFHRHGI